MCVRARLICFSHMYIIDRLPDELILPCCYCVYGIINTFDFSVLVLNLFVCNLFFFFFARCQTLSYYLHECVLSVCVYEMR